MPALVPVPASENPAPADKPAKSKAELKAERRARQEAERTSKQGKKGEVGQQAATSKPKAQPSELQPGTVISWRPAQSEVIHHVYVEKTMLFMCFFSGEEAPGTYTGGQPGGCKETGKETGKTTGWLLYVSSLKTLKR